MQYNLHNFKHYNIHNPMHYNIHNLMHDNIQILSITTSTILSMITWTMIQIKKRNQEVVAKDCCYKQKRQAPETKTCIYLYYLALWLYWPSSESSPFLSQGGPKPSVAALDAEQKSDLSRYLNRRCLNVLRWLDVKGWIRNSLCSITC